MEIKSRLWIEKEGKPFIGFGRINLLKQVDETASISAAAKALKMSYKKAWNLLNEIETLAEQPVLVKNIGGKNGGGTQVTDYGKSLILQFETLNQNCINFLEEEYKKLEL
ncbi:winged helix-turn-helix domain-containing protein [uncultured Winogradskyella sp.]|uniref:winged helix-turn-helix domain-containing protein n=1 Tax=Winogradskyella sp. 4-2091 TaxID=3381659 RepID=UPI0026243C0F|nr:LysR family transcriptional regulator [uncultured Winogradskyella sp.]